ARRVQAPIPAREDGLEIGLGLDEDERGGRNAVEAEDFLGARFVEAEREREGIASRVRDVEELADRRHVGLAIRAVESFGDVEDDVGSRVAEVLWKVGGGLEADDLTE